MLEFGKWKICDSTEYTSSAKYLGSYSTPPGPIVTCQPGGISTKAKAECYIFSGSLVFWAGVSVRHLQVFGGWSWADSADTASSASDAVAVARGMNLMLGLDYWLWRPPRDPAKLAVPLQTEKRPWRGVGSRGRSTVVELKRNLMCHMTLHAIDRFPRSPSPPLAIRRATG